MGLFDFLFKPKAAKPGAKKPAKPDAKKAKPVAKPAADLTAGAAPAAKKANVEKRFRLLNRVGQGSMSKTWRANDLQSGRTVCLKVLDKPKTEMLKKRFVGLKRPDEGAIAVTLDHPNVVKTFEYGKTTKGEDYLVMEYIDGVGFNVLVETRSQQLVGRELDLLIQMADGLAYFHERKFIHRDVCPRNAMVSSDGVLKLIDFGLAVPDTPDFRRPGNRTGTANYMAPELIKRATTDQRIDVFSFGVTAFETYTGTLPWESAQSIEAMMQHINRAPRVIQEINPAVPDDVVRFIERCMAKDPNRRFQSMKQVAIVLKGLRGDIDAEPTDGGGAGE